MPPASLPRSRTGRRPRRSSLGAGRDWGHPRAGVDQLAAKSAGPTVCRSTMASESAIASARMQNPDRSGNEDRPRRDMHEAADVEGADERDEADDANTVTTEREDLRRGGAAVPRVFRRAVGRRRADLRAHPHERAGPCQRAGIDVRGVPIGAAPACLLPSASIGAESASCRSGAVGITVVDPVAWDAYSGDPQWTRPSSDPEPITISPDSGLPSVAIHGFTGDRRHADVEADEAAGTLSTAKRSEAGEVDGHPAVASEIENTGEGHYGKGVLQTVVLADRGTRGTRYDANVAVLEGPIAALNIDWRPRAGPWGRSVVPTGTGPRDRATGRIAG